MAGAGVGVGAEIMDTGGAGAEYKSLWLRNTGLCPGSGFLSLHRDRLPDPTSTIHNQCCGSASIMRIRIQDLKNVHMDPDPRR